MKSSFHLNRNARDRWLSLCLFGGLGLVCATGAGGPETPGDSSEEEPEAEFTEWDGGSTEYIGWVNVTLGKAFLDLSKPEFRRRQGLNSGSFGGIADFYYENFVGENGMIQLGGRGLGGHDTYGFNLAYLDDTKGYLKFGVDSRRTWSTGNGGYSPPLGTWQPLDPAMLHLDRQKFWIEAGLTLEDKPAYRVGYSHETRKGATDSTLWGGFPGSFTSRNVAASFRGIDESRDTVTFDVEHTLRDTEAGIGFRFDSTRVSNSLNFRNDPGAATETRTTEQDVVQTDLFNAHAHTITQLNTNLAFSTGYSFTRLDTDLSGSRIEGTSYNSVFDPAVQRFPGFLDLAGGTVLNQSVVSLNLLYRPSANWSVIPAVRAESSSLGGASFFTSTFPGSITQSREVRSEQDFLDFSERLEIRYTGATNWVFRALGEWEQNDGDLNERQRAVSGGTLQMARDTELKRFGQKYTLGANWYPRPKFNLATQYYYKRRNNRFDHGLDTTPNAPASGDRYPAYLTRQNFETHDINLRITARPLNGVVAVTRYDHQFSRVETGGNAEAINSAKLRSHIISQSLTWSPLTRLYLQGTGSLVFDTTDTPSAISGPTAVVIQSKNSYWTAGFTAAYVLDLKTDLNIDYLYSRADNYYDNSAGSQPYGAGFEEHRILTTLTRRISENLRVLFHYGWFRNRDTTYGGNLNYTAHLASTSLQYRF